jgi:hypothetical protein
MLTEYRDLKLREDVVLRLFTTALKNLAVELDAFILTSTQISNDDDNKTGGFRDFRNIQGSRAITNLVDFACIMSRPSVEELQLVEGFQKLYHFVPNIITDVFKNRRGRWTMIRIWSLMDLGTMRRYDLFVTNPKNEPIEEFQIIDFSFEKSKEMEELEDFYNNGTVTPQIEQEIVKENVLEKTLVESITKAFGDIKEERKRVEAMDFDDFL